MDLQTMELEWEELKIENRKLRAELDKANRRYAQDTTEDANTFNAHHEEMMLEIERLNNGWQEANTLALTNGLERDAALKRAEEAEELRVSEVSEVLARNTELAKQRDEALAWGMELHRALSNVTYLVQEHAEGFTLTWEHADKALSISHPAALVDLESRVWNAAIEAAVEMCLTLHSQATLEAGPASAEMAQAYQYSADEIRSLKKEN